jgi:hypothetical protein
MPDHRTLKTSLMEAGFEIYRSKGAIIHLAERPRPNLILDSGVAAVRATEGEGDGETLRVRIVFRAASSQFTGEPDDALYARARSLAVAAQSRGFEETGAGAAPIPSPSDANIVLDTHYEVAYERNVANINELLDELRTALSEPRERTPDS